MSGNDGDDLSRRTVLKRVGAAGAAAAGVTGVATASSESEESSASLAAGSEAATGAPLQSNFITTKTDCVSSGCDCYASDPFYRQERKEVTKKCGPFGAFCITVDESSCGSCDPETGYGDC